ncbi:unnamed protein product, partial [Mesorhabditis belari]|uniref:BED-type domain-containing protein n=1 Tax=Mesorhabditis belari TaxID=2138241 RepID=A0AAF3FSG3_9BILA
MVDLCNICPLTFHDTQDLSVHIKGAHSDDVLGEYLKLVIAQQQTPSLVPRPPPNPIHRLGRRGHPCWKFFHRIDRFDAVCLLCSIRVRSACSTNLSRHLTRHHPIEAQHVREAQFARRNHSFNPLPTDGFDQSLINFVQQDLREELKECSSKSCNSLMRRRRASETVCFPREKREKERKRARSAPPLSVLQSFTWISSISSTRPFLLQRREEEEMDGDSTITTTSAARPVALRPLVPTLPLSSPSTWCSTLPASVSAAYQELRPATHSYDLFVDHLQQHKYETQLPKYDYSLAAYDGVSKVFGDDSVILKTDDVKAFDPHPHIHSVVVTPMAAIAEFAHPSLCATSFPSNLSTASSSDASSAQSQLVQQLEQHQLHGQLSLNGDLTREQLITNTQQQLQHTLAQQQHHQIQLQAPSVIETRKSAEVNGKGDGATPAKRGRPTENPCWNYFIRLDDQNVRCRICSKVVKSACATNMTKHLERHHQNDYQHLIVQIKQYRQQKVPQSVLPLTSTHQGCILPTPGHFVKSESPYVHDIYSQQFDCHESLLRNYVMDTSGHQVVWPRSSSAGSRTWSSFDTWNSHDATTSAMGDAWSQSLVPNDPTQPLSGDKPYLKRNRKTEHPVWEFFKRTVDGNAQCAICGGVVKSPCSSNFMRHLMRHHSAEYNAVYVKWIAISLNFRSIGRTDSSTTACVPTDFYYSAISFYCTICFKMTTMVLNNYSITDASTYFKTVYCPKVGLFKKRCLKAVQSLLDPLRTQLAPECEGESVETTVSFFCQNVVGMCYLQDNSYDCPSYVLGIPNLKDQIVQRQHDEL